MLVSYYVYKGIFVAKTARIIGTGSYLPERILTNADLEKMVETSDEWIFTRTGMKERRIAKENAGAVSRPKSPAP